jgi:hypothetical protein
MELGGPSAQAGGQAWGYVVGPYKPESIVKDINEMNDWIMSSGIILA